MICTANNLLLLFRCIGFGNIFFQKYPSIIFLFFHVICNVQLNLDQVQGKLHLESCLITQFDFCKY